MRIRVWSIGLLFTLLGALAQADDRGGMYMGAGSCLYYFELGAPVLTRALPRCVSSAATR